MSKWSSAFLCALLLSTAATGGKPGGSGGSGTADPQIAYAVRAAGTSGKLILANANNSNQSTIYSGPHGFRFDLAPRGKKMVAVSVDSSTDPHILLITYDVNGSGAYVPTSTRRIASSRWMTNVDFSPDGSKLAFACCQTADSEQLVVYDLNTDQITTWGSNPYYWDIAWFRGGNSLAYSSYPSGAYTHMHLYELTGPGADPIDLFSGRSDMHLDAARTDPNALVLNYRDNAGNAFTGLWKNGALAEPNMTNTAFSWNSGLSCDDRELVFRGPNGQQEAWFIRDRQTGLTRTFSKSILRWVQFFPTCS